MQKPTEKSINIVSSRSEQISFPQPITVTSRQTFGVFVKRIVDIVGAALIVVFLSPLLLMVTILIKRDSAGPAIFKQTRTGLNNKTFTLYKFRSMFNNAEAEQEGLRGFNEATGPLFKMKKDPRITRVGYWLRKTSLDEFPQFVNVLKGEMSLVGPRPPLPDEVEEYGDKEMQRLSVTPGITGLWQINGRSELSFEEMVNLDLTYIDNWSLWLDLKILALTMPAVFSRRGAY